MNGMEKWFIYALIFIVGFTGVSLWSFWTVVRPPKYTHKLTPADFNLPSEDVTLVTSDGVQLSTWFVPAETSSGRAIILLHGYPFDKTDMLSTAASLYPDFTLLLLDLRYFGESGGRYTTLGIKERADLDTAVNFLTSRGYEKIGVFGFSLGGATALLSAADDQRINAIAAYAPFSDMRTLGREAYRGLWVLKYPLVELMLLYGLVLFGESPTVVSPVNAARKLSIPVFIIHTKPDEQISFRHAEALKDALAGNPQAEFYFPETGLHGELPPDFDWRLKHFFERAL